MSPTVEKGLEMRTPLFQHRGACPQGEGCSSFQVLSPEDLRVKTTELSNRTLPFSGHLMPILGWFSFWPGNRFLFGEGCSNKER